MRYFVSLGSNIDPARNVPLMLQALLQLSPSVAVSRVVQTVPVGVVGAPFLNAAAAIATWLSPEALKASLNAIEAGLGRDRAAPDSKTQSRTADLDILFALDPQAGSVPAELLPPEPYILPTLLDLLAALGLSTPGQALELAPGAPLSLDGLPFGAAPRVFSRTSGRLTAVDLAADQARVGQA